MFDAVIKNDGRVPLSIEPRFDHKHVSPCAHCRVLEITPVEDLEPGRSVALSMAEPGIEVVLRARHATAIKRG